jgi:predicted RNA methylase
VVGDADETEPDVSLGARSGGIARRVEYFQHLSLQGYKVAARPVLLPAWPTFLERAQNVLAAKEEIDKIISYHKSSRAWQGRVEFYELDAERLVECIEPVDYVFTDPPYGGHISYLDLSTLWNAWLGRLPNSATRAHELIVGGELGLSEEHYLAKLAESMRACFRVSRPHRWISVVFQHWNVAYFKAILEAAASCGGELKAAISQVGDPIWSMHKKKNQESVLAGEMILTFQKTGKAARAGARRPFDVAGTLRAILDEHGPAPIHAEYLFNRLVIEAWKAGAIDALNLSRETFAELLLDAGWRYDRRRHQWTRDLGPRTPLGVLWR